jgi:protein-tyrosine phosphatase
MKDEICWLAGPWSGRLGIAARPRGGDWLGDEVRSWYTAGVQVVVSLLTPDEEEDLGLEDEEKLFHAAGLEFHRLPMPDRGVPPSRSDFADLMHRVEAALRGGKNAVIHCRQGIGRSSLLAASLLVGAGEAPEQAFKNIAKARGVPVPETPEQRGWVERLADELAPARQ